MSQPAQHPATASPVTTTALTGVVLVPPPDYALIPLTGMVVIIAGVLIAAFWGRRLKRSSSAQSFELLSNSGLLADQLRQLTNALAATDARLTALAARLDEQSRSTQGAAATSYNVAIRMARSGASRQELISTCGVTQQEADLVLRLHAVDHTHGRSAA